MKSRKLNFLHHLSTLVLLIFLASCEPDNVVEPTIEGKYNCEETVAASGSTPASKTTFEFHVISTSADNSTYKIENFYNIGFQKSLNINYANGNISIPEQNMDGFVIKGSGSVVSSKLNLSYTAKDAGGSIETCTAVAIKK
jgi:hypothetical protein